jgi:glutamate racemase
MDRPIGIFDSGVGGLTVFRAISRRLPLDNIVYFGDTAHLPYGSKSAKTVTRFSLANTRFLLSKRIKVLVAACNTASAISLPAIKREFALPVIGVIAPGAEKAVKATKNGCIGVIGTEATIRSGAYQRELKTMSKSIRVISQPCPLFVPLVEEGWYKEKVTIEVVKKYFERLKKEGIDTLILGCTHYPLLKSIFSRVLGNRIALVDSAEEVAGKVKEILVENGIEKKRKEGGYRHYFASDLHERFIKTGELFLGEKMRNVKEVDLERYYA